MQGAWKIRLGSWKGRNEFPAEPEFGNKGSFGDPFSPEYRNIRRASGVNVRVLCRWSGMTFEYPGKHRGQAMLGSIHFGSFRGRIISSILAFACSGAIANTPTKGDLYFTCSGGNDRVNKVSFDFDG